jgi:hypothetical protein
VFRNRVSSPLSILSAGIWMAVLPFVALTQDTSASKPATLATPSAQAAVPMVQSPEKKTKKVWTNDDVKSVQGGVSVVGEGDKGSEPAQGREAAVSSHRQSVEGQQLANYRNQIQQFRAQIDAIDKRIVQLRDFKAEDGSASGGIKMHQTYNMVPLEEQVKQLESKKKELQAKVADVENQARKSGIEPGELR